MIRLRHRSFSPPRLGTPARLGTAGVLTAAALGVATWLGAADPAAASPSSPREAYNFGVAKLEKGDLAGAETLLHSAVASNQDALQPSALYNLGIVRFEQGKDELKKGQDAKQVTRQGQAGAAAADSALQEGFDALTRANLDALVAAYRRGRGVRKELKAVVTALQEAIERHGVALSRWQRSSGDFRSSLELSGEPHPGDAAHNADVVDRNIARLADTLRQMQMLAQQLGEKRQQLDQLLAQMKGMVPEELQDKGPGEEEEDEEKNPKGPQEGQEESRAQKDEQKPLSPEAAARLLQSFQLDRSRSLPMGMDKTGQPKDPNRRNW